MHWFYLVVGIVIGIFALIILDYSRPRCRHIWKIVDKHDIEVMGSYGKSYTHTVSLFMCQSCGELIRINLTTGEKTMLVSGGTPVEEEELNIGGGTK